MALLSQEDRNTVSATLQKMWSRDRTQCTFGKPTLNQAIGETDGWQDTHQGLTGDTVGFNGSLHLAARNAMTANQKNDMFTAVAAMRRGPTYFAGLFRGLV